MESIVSGQGQSLVLIGGGLQGTDSWGPLVDRLNTTRRVIRLQNLNVASGLKGDTLPSGYSVKVESAAAIRALDTSGIKDFDLIGWSSGGSIALDLALDHPDRVKSLTLIEPIAVWILSPQERNDTNLKRMTELARTLRGPISDEQFEAFMCGNGSFKCSEASPRSSPLWPRLVRYKQSLNGLAAYTQHTESVERLKTFRKPVLIITGTQSASFAKTIDQRLSQQFFSAKSVELPGGHASFLTSPDLFLETLTSFLQHTK